MLRVVPSIHQDSADLNGLAALQQKFCGIPSQESEEAEPPK